MISTESTFKAIWNIIIVILLLYTAIFVPVKVAFIDDESNAIYYMELFVDIAFGMDIIINFFSAYDDA